MESNFDYVLMIDGDERILHASECLCKDSNLKGIELVGNYLEDLLILSSLESFRSAVAQARSGNRSIAVFTPSVQKSRSISLKAQRVSMDGSDNLVLMGNRVDSLSKQADWEKDERIKELACLYKVAEWIEASGSIHEFFTEFPKHLSSGMLHPDDAVVHSVYQGVEYGRKPASDNHISVKLVVGRQVKGEVQVGYPDGAMHELLPEEQKMLDEIARMLNLALERKELRERLIMKQEEENEYSMHLKELEAEIARRTRELEEQKRNLDIVNSYLDRTNKSWEESKTTLETMFQAIPDEVVLLDRNRKILMTNRKDIEPGEVCFRAFFDRDRPCEDCRLARILRDRTPLTLTIKHDNRFLEVHALPFYNEEHEVNGIMEFYRDVTLEMTYEQQLQQADKLASLGQLVSGIGHEINNPNQFIRGNIKIIRQSLEDMLPIIDEYYKSHHDLEVARLKYNFFRRHIMTLVDDMGHGSERIKKIVESLRTFIRKDEGLLVDTVDINTLIEASARLVHNQVHKNADINLELADDIPPFFGNSQKIEQILINLVVNAGDAMTEGTKGLITIRTRTEDGFVVVEAEDNGCGMDQKTLKQIFDPFFTTKRARGGTGLGLAIAYKIIAEHNGVISVTSKPGVGTKFIIKIPARAAAEVPGKAMR
jgi:signal transduction histidine kinase